MKIDEMGQIIIQGAWAMRHLGWLLLGGAVLAVGCKQEDADRLARVGQKVTTKLQTVTLDTDHTVLKEWQAVCHGWDETTLAGRVAARLRWDKKLADTPIQVSAKGNEVELKGTLREESQRQRAVELATLTAGVEKVHDALEAPSP
jgi:hypothetical protein